MFKKKIYKYKENNRTVVSPYKPNCEYEEMYRLMVQDENYLLTNYDIFVTCIDIPKKDLELWEEVDKDTLFKNETLEAKVNKLEKSINSLISVLTETLDIKL